MKASVIKEMTTEEIKARVEAESSSLDKLKMNQVVRALAQSLSSPAIGTLPLWQRQS